MGFAARLYFVLAFPPTSDVYYYDTEAARLLLSGIDPYGHVFTGIPQQLATPGAENVFAYMPFTVVFIVPFYLLGDVRFAAVAADLIIALALFQYSRRWSFLAAALFLLVPVTYYVNDAAFATAFVALSLALESRAKDLLAAVALGVGLACSLFVWLALPFFAYRYVKKGTTSKLVTALATPVAICLPFIIANPFGFFHDILFFQLSRSATPFFVSGGPFGFTLNPSLSGITTTIIGQPTPLYLRLVVVFLALVLLLYRLQRDHGEPPEASPGHPIPEPLGVLYGSVFVAVAVVIVPSIFFFAYLELPIALFLAWLGAR